MKLPSRLAVTIAAVAQAYPNGPVRMVTPFPPGGASDHVGRATIGTGLVADKALRADLANWAGAKAD